MSRPSARRRRGPTPHAQMAASPHPVRLGGKTYVMSPLTDRDWGELELWMQMRPIALAKEAIRRNPDLDEAQRKNIFDAATTQMVKLSVATPEGAAMLVSVDGVSMLTWIGLRAQNPDVTLEQVRAMMFSPDNIHAAMDAFDAANQNGPIQNPTMPSATTRRAGRSTSTPGTEPQSTSPSASTTPGPAQT